MIVRAAGRMARAPVALDRDQRCRAHAAARRRRRPIATTSGCTTRRWSARGRPSTLDAPVPAAAPGDLRRADAALHAQGDEGSQAPYQLGAREPAATKRPWRRSSDRRLTGDRARRFWRRSCRFSDASRGSGCSTRWRSWCFGSARPACPTSIRAASCGTCRWSTRTIAGPSTSRCAGGC